MDCFGFKIDVSGSSHQRCSSKNLENSQKTPVLESLFNKLQAFVGKIFGTK